jgi:hypothetical protein
MAVAQNLAGVKRKILQVFYHRSKIFLESLETYDEALSDVGRVS